MKTESQKEHKQLTKPQVQLLRDLQAGGGTKKFNGRARSRIEALERAHLVTYNFTLRECRGGRYTELFTVTLTESGWRE